MRSVPADIPNDPSLRLSIRLFSGFRLEIEGHGPLLLSGRKGPALIAYLARNPSFSASRDKIAGLLWSDSDSEHARNSLRQTLTVLRRELNGRGLEIFDIQQDTVALRAASFSCDVQDFESALKGDGAADLDRALTIYSGPFLDGFFGGSEAFEEWAQRERSRLEVQAIECLERLLQLTSGETQIKYARRLLMLEPTHEAACRLMMLQLADAGQRDAALRVYEACKLALRKEIGAPPSPETEAVRQAILGGAVPDNGRIAKPASKQPPLAPPSQPTIRVSTLAALTEKRTEEHFGKGLVQDIMSALNEQSRLAVVFISTPQTDGKGPAPEPAHGTTRGRYVLSGGVQIVAPRIRVNLQLVDQDTGHCVWAERFEGHSEQPLELQDRVANSVALAARIELQQTSWNVRDKSPPGSPEVRRLVNQSLSKYYEMTRESLLDAIDLAEQALQLDPGHIRGMRTLSVVLSMAMAFGALPKRPETVERALALSEAAVLAVPEDEIARSYHAFALLADGRHEEAISELRHALVINPDYPNAHGDLAEHYALQGRAAEALEHVNVAFRLGSRDPVEFWRPHYVALAKFAAGDFEGALEAARNVAKLKPGFIRGALMWAASAAACGHMDEATRAVHHCLSQMPDLRLSNVAPGFVPRYVQDKHHEAFIGMLRRAGMPA